MDDKTIQI